MKKYVWGMMLAVVVMMGCATHRASVSRWKTMPELSPMPKPDASGLAPVNGIQLYYAIFNREGKDPVMLLHGGLTSSDYWSREVPLLAKKHKVIVVDNRGHGRSTLSDQPFTYNLMASDVKQLMDYLHIPKVSIVGWSDGGIMGLILAMQHRGRIDKLFTYATNFSRSGEKAETPDSVMRVRFITQAEANYRSISPTPQGFKTLRKALFKMYGAEPELDTAALKTITARTVVACGEYEQFYTREHFQQLANLIPGARLVVLPAVSHGGPLQDPAGFHRAVANLMDAAGSK